MKQWVELSRRRFLTLASLGGVATVLVPWRRLARNAWAVPDVGRIQRPRDPQNLTSRERDHVPEVQLPLIAEDGSNVPINLQMNMEQTSEHYIRRLDIYNFNDPVIHKGTYHFTPASGRVALSTQLRMNGGDTDVFVVAECNQHGRWLASRPIKVSIGGC